MSGPSHSSAKTSTATNSTTNASETNTSTSTNVDSNNTTTINNSTDAGAVLAATDLGKAAIAANQGLSESLLAEGGDITNHALDILSASQTQSANLVGQTLTDNQNFLSDVLSSVTGLESQNAQNLNSIATANTTSQASQSTAFAQNVLKYGAIVIAVGILGYVIIRSNSK